VTLVDRRPATAATGSGRRVRADIWFACHGAAPAVGYLAPDLLPEMKMARAAQRHAGVAAANIRALIAGDEPAAAYEPAADAIVLPLGPKHGVTYAPK
jgi:hypothetical protein